MNDHTRGPWKVHPQYARTIKAGSVSVASMSVRNKIKPDNPTPEEARSNARLIAETPMMHEVCKQIVECIRDCSSCDATGIHCGTKADACYDCGGVGQVLGGDDIFAAFDARDLLKRLAANDG